MARPQWYRHAVPLALALGFSLPAIAAGQGVPEPHVPVSTTLGDIAKLRTAFAVAYNAKDAAAVNATYAADAVEIGADGSETVGAQAIAKRNEAEAPNWPQIVLAPRSTKLYGSTAVETGTFTAHPAAGGEVVSRYLVVLRHSVNGWKLQYVANVPVPK